MITKYTIFRTDGTEKEGEVDWPYEPGYKRIASLVEPIIGGNLEHVSVLFRDKAADMFVDELGHVRKEGPKPYNKAATYIYQTYSVSKGVLPEELPIIVGDAVVFGRQVWY